MRNRFHALLLAALALSAMAARAYALEHITLANGSEFDCTRHELVDGNWRLYLAGGSAGNFIDVAQAAVVRVEALPDPPAPRAVAAAKMATSAPVQRSAAEPTPAELKQLLSSAGAQHNIDAALLASVVTAESGGHALAVSRTGARGLMQLMPATASTLGVSDSFAPDQNVAGGTRYLDELLTRYHDNVALALAAYNAGPAAVDRYHGIPPYRETRLYVAHVIREFNRRKSAELQAR